MYISKDLKTNVVEITASSQRFLSRERVVLLLQVVIYLGALVSNKKSEPETPPAIGTVNTHEERVHPTIVQLIDFLSALQRPTAMVAPHMQWVVETGRPRKDAVMTVKAAPSSIENPRDGE